MEKNDAIEADGIIQRTLVNLSAAILHTTGGAAIYARSVIGWTAANSLLLLFYDQMGAPLDACFDLTRKAGATLPKMETVRVLLDAEYPKSVGATTTRDTAILLSLAQEGKIISTLVFRSRQDVDGLIKSVQTSFNKAEEVTANSSDPMLYRAVVELRAAIINHLTLTARPLPSLLPYQFAVPLPSLVISQKLYGNASHYDDIRNENKIVHPAFCPRRGQALSQ